MQALNTGTAAPGKTWWDATRQWWERITPPAPSGPRIGLALGGGFARGIAHVGVLRVLEQNKIPIHCISGVSAGAMVAAAYASGASAAELEWLGRALKFR